MLFDRLIPIAVIPFVALYDKAKFFNEKIKSITLHIMLFAAVIYSIKAFYNNFDQIAFNIIGMKRVNIVFFKKPFCPSTSFKIMSKFYGTIFSPGIHKCRGIWNAKVFSCVMLTFDQFFTMVFNMLTKRTNLHIKKSRESFV